MGATALSSSWWQGRKPVSLGHTAEVFTVFMTELPHTGNKGQTQTNLWLGPLSLLKVLGHFLTVGTALDQQPHNSHFDVCHRRTWGHLWMRSVSPGICSLRPLISEAYCRLVWNLTFQKKLCSVSRWSLAYLLYTTYEPSVLSYYTVRSTPESKHHLSQLLCSGYRPKGIIIANIM